MAHNNNGEQNGELTLKTKLAGLYLESLTHAIPLNDICLIALMYLEMPTMNIGKSLSFGVPTNRYYITLDVIEDMLNIEKSLVKVLFHALDAIDPRDWYKYRCIVYQETKTRLRLFLDAGSSSLSTDLVKTDSLGILNFVLGTDPSGMALAVAPFVQNVAITEVSDKIFADQWISHVGCHGFGKYPEYVMLNSEEPFTSVESSYQTYMKQYWDERKEKGCSLTNQCGHDNPYHWCPNTKMHHLCRKQNNQFCKSLDECVCECSMCEYALHTECECPEQYKCFRRWSTLNDVANDTTENETRVVHKKVITNTVTKNTDVNIISTDL